MRPADAKNRKIATFAQSLRRVSEASPNAMPGIAAIMAVRVPDRAMPRKAAGM